MNNIISSNTRNDFQNETGNLVSWRRISVSSTLELPITQAWEELQKWELLRYVSHGMTLFWELPETWEVWEEVQTLVKAKLFWILPLPWKNPYNITFDSIDSANHTAYTQENGSGISAWNHLMEMREITPDITQYTDTIDIYAEKLTGIISAHAHILYKHRHSRWKNVVEILNSWNTMNDVYKTIPVLT